MNTQDIERLEQEHRQALEELSQARYRLQGIPDKIADLTEQVEAWRQARRRLLANGGDHEDVSANLKGAEEKLELLREEETGLQDEINRLGQEERTASFALKHARRDAWVEERVKPAVLRYNELARQFTDVICDLDDILASSALYVTSERPAIIVTPIGHETPVPIISTISLAYAPGGERPAFLLDDGVLSVRRRMRQAKGQ